MKSLNKIFAFIFILTCMALSPNSYANECDAHFIDSVGKADVVVVNREAQSLVSKGIEPRIRIIQNYDGYGNLDSYERALVKRCPSMSGADGGRKGNLLTVIVEMDNRQIGIYYGSDYHNPLDSKWKRVKDRTIIPNLKSGNFTGALTDGMDELGQFIYDYENPVVLTPAQIEAQNQARIEAQERRAQSKKNFIKGFFGFLAFLLTFACLYGLFVLLSQYLKNRRHIAKIKASLAEVKNNLLESINDSQLSDLSSLQEKIDSLRDHVSKQDMDIIIRSWDDVREGSEAHMSSVEILTKSDDGNTEEKILDKSNKYEELANSIDAHGLEISQFEDYLYATKESVLNGQETLSNVTETLDFNADKCSQIMTSMNSKSDKSSELTVKSYEILNSARNCLSRKQITRFEDFCAKAVKVSEDALKICMEHKDLHASIVAQKKNITTSRAVTLRKQGLAKESFSRISSKYAKCSWDAFKGHGSRAQRLLERSQSDYDKAIESFKVDKLNLTKTSLDTSQKLLTEAKELFIDVIDIEKKIITAEKRSAIELRLAQTDIKKAERYIKENSKDIKKSFGKYLSDSKSILSQAKRENQKSKPNYLIVVEKALEANQMSDKILEQAMTEKQETKRKERLIKEQIKRVESQIQTASRYHRSHRGDVSSSAKRSLTQAQNQLSRALETAHTLDTLDNILSIIRKANDTASSSLSSAKSDVSSAESSRRAAQRRRQSSYSSSSSSSSSYGGGGSSSWSGSSFGGSFGGGGSSGW